MMKGLRLTVVLSNSPKQDWPTRSMTAISSLHLLSVSHAEISLREDGRFQKLECCEPRASTAAVPLASN